MMKDLNDVIIKCKESETLLTANFRATLEVRPKGRVSAAN